MNKIYSLVWNRLRGRVEVASELAHARRSGASTSGVARTTAIVTMLATAVALAFGIVSTSVFAAPTSFVDPDAACSVAARLGADTVRNCTELSQQVAIGVTVVDADADDATAPAQLLDMPASHAGNPFGAVSAPMVNMVAANAVPMVLPPGAPQRPPASGAVPSGLMMGTGGLVGNVGGALNPTLTSLFNPNSAYLSSGNMQLAAANVTQTFVTTKVLGVTLLNLTPVGSAVNGTLTGYDQRLTLLGGATSGSYITNVNRGTDGFQNGTLGLVLPNGAPAWADSCANILGLVTAPCWAVNAAQNNQVVIGDGASANGSEEVVIGTGASHTLPSVDADTAFPGDGNRNSATDPMGVPDSDYQARMGHSVVIGDSASGSQDMQTILGANATSDQANSVALGYGSNADRGALPGYTNAPGLTGIPQDSVGELAVGSTGHNRQITHVAAGTDDYDAVNVLQLEGAVASAATDSVQYDDATHASVTLGGVGAAAPVALTNVAAGNVASGSTDAINGDQLYAVQQVANNANQGWNVTTAATGTGVANGSTIANIAPGGTATLVADNNIIATQTDAAIAIGVNPILTGLTSIAFTAGGPVISGGGIDMGGTRITDLAAAQDASDAVTLGQLDTALAGVGGNLHYVSVNDGGTQGGNYANDGASGANALAIGVGAVADGDGSAALGYDADTAGFADSVALGSGSVVDRADSVSVGAPGAERQITNVAAASQPTDAVNLAQVDAMTNGGAAALTSHYFKAGGPADGSDDAAASGALSVAAGSGAGAGGDFSMALGATATSSARRAIAIGQKANASGAQAFALGTYSAASGNNSVALGGAIDINGNGVIDGDENTVASGGLSVALGVNARSTAGNASAVGAQAEASGIGSTAVGSNAFAVGTGSSALGFGSQADAYASVALGWYASAMGQQGIAAGHGARAAGDFSVALGVNAYTSTRRAIAVGQGTVASGAQAFALGTYAAAEGANSVALGGAIDLNSDGKIEPDEITTATGGLSMALGVNAQATAGNASAIGSQAVASGLGSTAVGSNALTSGKGAVALGFGSQASSDNAVAIGWNSVANVANTVSVGSAGNYRRVVNVADPTGAHDAVTLGYLQANYTSTDALASLSQQMDALNKQMANLGRASASSAAPAVAQASGDSPVPEAGSAAVSSQTQQAVTSANAYTDQQTQEALQSANTYAQSQGTQAVSSAKAYTDAALANYVTTDTFNQYQQQVDTRFHMQDTRIDRLGAMGAASTHMAMSAAGAGERGRVAVGAGFYNGQSALSIGYAKSLGGRANINFGGAFSGSEVSGGVGFGLDL